MSLLYEWINLKLNWVDCIQNITSWCTNRSSSSTRKTLCYCCTFTVVRQHDAARSLVEFAPTFVYAGDSGGENYKTK